jgi:hypothetical protein
MKEEPGTAGHFLKTWHIMPTSNSHAVPSFFARFLYRMKDKGALSANKVANDSLVQAVGGAAFSPLSLIIAQSGF